MDLPTASVQMATQGAGSAGAASELLCVMTPVSQGQLYTPRLYTAVQDALDVHGFHEGAELCAMNVEKNKQPFLHIGLDNVTAGAIGTVDVTGVLGTSAVSFSGNPVDDEDIWVLCDTAFTVGTTGGVIRVSRDGGRTYGKKVRMGTATSYLVPRTGVTSGVGVTVSFGIGTVLAGDIAKARCESPKADAAAYLAAFTALAATGHLPRLIVGVGDIDTITKCQELRDLIHAYETTHQRHARMTFSARQRYADCAMQHSRGFFKKSATQATSVVFDAAADTITRVGGSWIDDGFVVGQAVQVTSPLNTSAKGVLSAVSATVLTLPASPGLVNETADDAAELLAVTIVGDGPGDLDFTASDITRNIGSFVSDGFKPGMTITITGTASNDGTRVVTAVSATVLTAAGGATESNKASLGVSITGTETFATWRAAVNVIVGNTPQTAVIGHRAGCRGGRARKGSPIDGTRRRRPVHWFEAIRIMGHDLHVSPAKMDLGELGVTIHDENGILEDHDERVHGGLLAMRVGCLTTSDDFKGVFIADSPTLDDDDAPLSLIQVGFVGDLACRVAKRETTRRLNSDVDIYTDTGFIKEYEAKRIEEQVTTELKSALLTIGAEGARASAVSFTMARNVDLRVASAETPIEVLVTQKGYLRKFSTTVRMSQGG